LNQRENGLYKKVGFFTLKCTQIQQKSPDDQFVYIAKIGDKVKIGTTADLKVRLSNIQTNTPEKVELLASIKGGRKLEKVLHEGFESSRFKGEWFNYTKEIQDYVQQINDRQGVVK